MVTCRQNKFNPEKYKWCQQKRVLRTFLKNLPPKKKYFHKLGGIKLQFANEEKDFGISGTSMKFTWEQQVDSLSNKSSPRLGVLKRTMHFVKCQKQRRASYLEVVRSQFEYCVQIWRPSSDSLNRKLERIQRRAVKWIVSEKNRSDNDLE